MSVTYISGRTKDSLHLVYQDYRFSKDRTRNGVTYWRCMMSRKTALNPHICKARVSTDVHGNITSFGKEHNHPANILEIQIRTCISNIRRITNLREMNDLQPKDERQIRELIRNISSSITYSEEIAKRFRGLRQQVERLLAQTMFESPKESEVAQPYFSTKSLPRFSLANVRKANDDVKGEPSSQDIEMCYSEGLEPAQNNPQSRPFSMCSDISMEIIPSTDAQSGPNNVDNAHLDFLPEQQKLRQGVVTTNNLIASDIAPHKDKVSTESSGNPFRSNKFPYATPLAGDFFSESLTTNSKILSSIQVNEPVPSNILRSFQVQEIIPSNMLSKILQNSPQGKVQETIPSNYNLQSSSLCDLQINCKGKIVSNPHPHDFVYERISANLLKDPKTADPQLHRLLRGLNSKEMMLLSNSLNKAMDEKR